MNQEDREPADPAALGRWLVGQAEAQIAAGDLEAARATVARLAESNIDDSILAASDAVHARLNSNGTKRIATGDPLRRPAQGEQIVIYGNYPHCAENLLCNDIVRRHVSWFWNINHDAIEADAAWNDIAKIYIINEERRADRLDSVLGELARMRAPLNRIERIAAAEPSAEEKAAHPSGTAGAIGCLTSHLALAERIADEGHAHVLVLEDDFTFTSDTKRNLADLAAFTSRNYRYDVCMLGYSKYGRLIPIDDLVARSEQPVTNTEAYLVSPAGSRELIGIWRQALDGLRATGDVYAHAADRSWAALQPLGGFMAFRRKLGFQTASYSSIEGHIARYFD